MWLVQLQLLEPWLVNRVNVKGGLTTVSILAKGLPVTEDVDLVADAQQLKATSLSNKRLLLLIGVFSSGNNFERRMALRRTWMQYDVVRSGGVAVRFFIGLVSESLQTGRNLFNCTTIVLVNFSLHPFSANIKSSKDVIFLCFLDFIIYLSLCLSYFGIRSFSIS